MTTVRAWADFAGRRADGKLIRGLVPQFDGSRYGADNCASASEADRIIRNQLGIRPAQGAPWHPTGASIRLATGDTYGGMTPRQTTDATERVYGIGNDVRIVAWSEVTAWLRKGGSAVILIGYGPIADAGKSGSPGFRGNHSVAFSGIRGSGTGIEFLDADPLYDGRRTYIPEGPQWISVGLAKRAAGALVVGAHGERMARLYPGSVYVSFGTRAYTPPVLFKLYPGATKLRKPRVYTPTRRLYMRKSPKLIATNRIGTVGPGFAFEAYQYIVNADAKWVGNKNGTAWLLFDSIRFVRYL